MVTLGGALKRREKITGRLADVLAWSYLASAALKRFHADGSPRGRSPARALRLRDLLRARRAGAATASCATCRTGRRRGGCALLALPLGRRERGPDDRARRRGRARGARRRGRARAADRRDLPRRRSDEAGLGRLDAALEDAQAALPIEAKLRRAVREGRLAHAPGDDLARAARAAGLLTDDEFALLRAAERARDEAIQVDAFAPEEFARLHLS